MHKSKLLALLLAVAMVISMVVVPAYAVDEDQPVCTHHTYNQETWICDDCGHVLTCSNPDHADATWTPFADRADRKPVGHYVMLADEDYDGSQITVDADTSLCLDMNGYTFTQSSTARAFSINGDAIIQGGGTIHCSAGGVSGAGANIAFGTGSMKMYGITVSGGTNGTSNGQIQVGSGTTYFENCTFTEGTSATGYGGHIDFKGGTSTLKNCSFLGGSAKYGGAVAVHNSGTSVTIDGCTFNGGNATDCGGNLYWYTGELILKNSTFTNGVAANEGGNIAIEGTNTGTLENLTVSGGVGAKGGNLAVFAYNANSPDITVSGGTYTGIENDKISYGGNIYAAGNLSKSGTATLTIKNATLTEGYATTRGGNIMVEDDTELTVTGCEISEGYAGARGGNIVIEDAGTEANLTNCTVSDGYAVNRGGNISVEGTAAAILNNLTVSGGTSERGGNVAVLNAGGSVVINGGTYDGESEEGTTRGGNLFAQNGYDTDVYAYTINGGARIIDGVAVQDGGNICLVYAKAHLVNCEISGGSAELGGNIALTSTDKKALATLVVEKDVTVSGGSASKDGDDINIGGGTDAETKTNVTIKTGASVGVVEATGEYMAVTVETGVISDNALSGALTTLSSIKDSETGKYTTYADLDAALATTPSEGNKVVLGKAEAVENLSVDGYTLDLNGQTLTAESVLAANDGAQIIDTKGNGLLKVAADKLALSDTNGYLPVAVDGGFGFEIVELQQKTEDLGNNSLKLKFIVADAADQTYLDTAIVEGNEVKFQIRIKWEGNEAGKTFEYSADQVKTYAGAWGTKMFTCTVNGLDNVTNPTFSAEIYSNGVVIAATDVTNQ